MISAVTILVILSILVTYLWRFTGVVVARNINPDGAVFEWLGCIAYAMLAGLMARVMVYPAGILAHTDLSDRLVAMALGFIVFFVLSRHFFAATVTATVSFYCLLMLFSP